MTRESSYLEINKKLWNKRTKIHIESEFYDNDRFIEGFNSLNIIELNLLGDLKGKSVLHLQCHFGQDSISLERLGADVTGIDLSDESIKAARELAEKTSSGTEFICCDVYDLPNHLHKKFDLVFTSYGTIGWLPDLNKWAGIISMFLKPEGKFVFVEFHPFLWMYDNDFKYISYNYFKDEAILEIEQSTYADTTAEINEQSVSWNHGISEVINSLIRKGMEIGSFEEYNYSPYNCFNNTEEFEAGKFRIKHLGNKIPMVYSIIATKNYDL